MNICTVGELKKLIHKLPDSAPIVVPLKGRIEFMIGENIASYDNEGNLLAEEKEHVLFIFPHIR